MTEAPIKPPAKGMSKTAIIAVVIAAIVIVAAVVIVVEERKAVTPTTSSKVEFYTWWATERNISSHTFNWSHPPSPPGIIHAVTCILVRFLVTLTN